jgi:beclin 1
MDSSLADLNPSAYDMVVASLPPTPTRPFLSEEDKLAQLRAPSSSKQAWQHAAHTRPPPSLSSGTKSPRMLGPAESFVMLQDSVVRTIPTSPIRPVPPMRGRTELAKPEPVEVPEPDPAPKSHHLRSTQRLLNLLSERTDIDHPLCAECTRILLSSLERRLEEARRERDGYLAFEKDIRKDKEREARNGVPPQKAKEDGEKKLQSLREEEKLAIEQLKQAEREREQLEEEMRALDLEEKVLEEEEAE